MASHAYAGGVKCGDLLTGVSPSKKPTYSLKKILADKGSVRSPDVYFRTEKESIDQVVATLKDLGFTVKKTWPRTQFGSAYIRVNWNREAVEKALEFPQISWAGIGMPNQDVLSHVSATRAFSRLDSSLQNAVENFVEHKTIHAWINVRLEDGDKVETLRNDLEEFSKKAHVVLEKDEVLFSEDTKPTTIRFLVGGHKLGILKAVDHLVESGKVKVVETEIGEAPVPPLSAGSGLCASLPKGATKIQVDELASVLEKQSTTILWKDYQKGQVWFSRGPREIAKIKQGLASQNIEPTFSIGVVYFVENYSIGKFEEVAKIAKTLKRHGVNVQSINEDYGIIIGDVLPEKYEDAAHLSQVRMTQVASGSLLFAFKESLSPIERAVALLGQFVEGYEDFAVNSTDPEQMLRKFIAMKYDDEDKVNEYTYEMEATGFKTEVSVAGVFSYEVGEKEIFNTVADHLNLEERNRQFHERVFKQILAILKANDAVLGFDGGDQSGAASPTTVLLVLDQANKTVYRVELTPMRE